MNCFKTAMAVVAVAIVTVVPNQTAMVNASTVAAPRVWLTGAPEISLPGSVDSNSPVMWDLEDGQRNKSIPPCGFRMIHAARSVRFGSFP